MSDRGNPFGRMLAELKRAEARATYCAEVLARYLAGGPNLSDPAEARRYRKLEADVRDAQIDLNFLQHNVDLVTGRA